VQVYGTDDAVGLHVHGEWLKIEAADDTIYVWGCGCCGLEVTRTPPEMRGDWEPVNPGPTTEGTPGG
jgi:hypothetical protein